MMLWKTSFKFLKMKQLTTQPSGAQVFTFYNLSVIEKQ